MNRTGKYTFTDIAQEARNFIENRYETATGDGFWCPKGLGKSNWSEIFMKNPEDVANEIFEHLVVLALKFEEHNKTAL